KTFYENIVPRLIGLNLGDIDKVLKELLYLGRLTGKLSLSDTKDLSKPKTQLKRAEQLLESIKDFLDSEESQLFTAIDLTLSRLKTTRKGLEDYLEQLEQARKAEQLKKLEKQLLEARNLDRQLNDLQVLGLDAIEEKFDDYRRFPGDFEAYKDDSQIWRRYGVIFFIITFIPIIPALFIPSLAFLGLLSLFGFGGVMYSLFQELNITKKIHAKKQLEEELMAAITAASLPVGTIDELSRYLREKNSEIDRVKNNLLGVTAILREACPEAVEHGKKINYDSVKQYLDEQSRDIDISIDIKFDEADKQQAKDKLATIGEEIENYNGKKSAFSEKMHDFNSALKKIDFQAFLGKDVDTEVKNIDSLEIVTEYLEELIELINTDRDISIEAYTILEQVHEKETAKIAKYFNDETQISSFMENISGGLFKEVKYDPEKGKFHVTREGDLEQSIDQLSRGELSQLYFVIRLALGARLLGSKGFMVMEDPFLPSDDERLDNQLHVLANFITEGWQVIFFTSKEDMKGKLEQIGGKLVKQLTRL
ncbi:MAG: ATP-binding protein, partial [Candidatus Hodarchaeales archaeon]